LKKIEKKMNATRLVPPSTKMEVLRVTGPKKRMSFSLKLWKYAMVRIGRK
jgi:hypothetical protein